MKKLFITTLSYWYIKNTITKQKQKSKLKKWQQSGCPLPPPHTIKQQMILKQQKQFNLPCFVETGTFRGDMIEAVRKHFQYVYSIELQPDFYRDAQQRFKRNENVKLIQGDSATQLKELVATLSQPALFWLDGHYSGGATARGRHDTPIMQELEHIYNFPLGRQSIVMIDDARCFGQDKDYPSIEEIEKYIKTKLPNVSITVEHDAIHIIPTQLLNHS